MAGRTITSSRTATTENTPNRRSSAASFFGTAGALTRRSDSRRQLLRPPINANAVVNELVDSEVVSDDANQNTSFNYRDDDKCAIANRLEQY